MFLNKLKHYVKLNLKIGIKMIKKTTDLEGVTSEIWMMR